jgi:hypothetical protein
MGEALIFRPYAPGDEARITVRADMQGHWDAAGHVLHEGVRYIAETRDGQVLGVGGFVGDEAAGMLDLWALCGQSLRPRHWAQIYRFVQTEIRRRRGASPGLEIWAVAENPRAAQFLVRLGFQAGAEPGEYFV